MLTASNILRASSRRHIWQRSFHDYVRYATPAGTARLPLTSHKLIGVSSSRGTRAYQEDFTGFATVSLDPEELKASARRAHGIDWDPLTLDEDSRRHALFVGIYDGHGGSAVSQYLRQELHGLFESVHKENIPETYAWIQELGGYFKRFRGGAIQPWIESGISDRPYDLEARFTQAFFEADRNLAVDGIAETCGATASVALMHSLDSPATPFFASKKLSLTVAHCGDTRVILCPADEGKPVAMTEAHHADARVEAIRLRRMMGSSLTTDSFGDSRWMGALQNTRSLGDLRYKRFGVTPEPEVRTKLLNDAEWSFVLMFSDGISSMVTDEEVRDIARNATNPKQAADKIVSYVEDLGGEDNLTAVVVPLLGWGKLQGSDPTKELREYKLQQTAGTERHRRM